MRVLNYGLRSVCTPIDRQIIASTDSTYAEYFIAVVATSIVKSSHLLVLIQEIQRSIRFKTLLFLIVGMEIHLIAEKSENL